jgi:hypothetical protein
MNAIILCTATAMSSCRYPPVIPSELPNSANGYSFKMAACSAIGSLSEPPAGTAKASISELARAAGCRTQIWRANDPHTCHHGVHHLGGS